jgi:dihydrolipoamide dehydrogenase
MKKNKIDTYDGWGNLEGGNKVRVALNGGNEETLTYKNLIIATARARSNCGDGDRRKVVVTYEEAILSTLCRRKQW